MKTLFAILVAILAGPASAQERPMVPVVAPDVIFQSHVNSTTLNWMIERLRKVRENAGARDYLSGTIIPSDFPLIELKGADDSATAVLLKRLGSFFDRDLTRAAFRIRVPSITYQVERLKLNPHSLETTDPEIHFGTEVVLEGIHVSLNQGMQVDIMIPNEQNQDLVSFATGTIDPLFFDISKSVYPFRFDVGMKITRGSNLDLSMDQYDLSRVPDYFGNYLKQFPVISNQKPLDADAFHVSPLTLKLNTLTRTVQFDELKPVLQKHLGGYLDLAMREVGKQFQQSIGPSILNVIFPASVPKRFEIDTSMVYTAPEITKLEEPASDQVEFELNARVSNGVAGTEPAYVPARMIPDEHRRLAQEGITNRIASGNADFVLSVSEEYLDRVLLVAASSQPVKELLEQNHLHFGAKKLFIVFDEETKVPQVYFDLFYEGSGKGVEKILINMKKPIHFPLHFGTELQFTTFGGIPHLMVNMEMLRSTREELMHGIDEFGLPSKLVGIIRKKIAKQILKLASALNGVNVIDLPLPQLQGIELNEFEYQTSKYGRLDLWYKITHP